MLFTGTIEFSNLIDPKTGKTIKREVKEYRITDSIARRASEFGKRFKEMGIKADALRRV